MHKPSYYIVNGITIYRIIATPLLALLVINNRLDVFKWLLTVSFLTDGVDGFIARKYKVISEMGAKLDSIGDDLTILVAVIAAIVFKLEFLKQEIILVIVLLTLYILQTAIAFIRYGKISGFHTYIAKTAAGLQAIFLLLLFFLPEPVYSMFYATVFVTAIDLIEEIILALLLPQWETNVKGLYWVLKRKNKQSF